MGFSEIGALIQAFLRLKRTAEQNGSVEANYSHCGKLLSKKRNAQPETFFSKVNSKRFSNESRLLCIARRAFENEFLISKIHLDTA